MFHFPAPDCGVAATTLFVYHLTSQILNDSFFALPANLLSKPAKPGFFVPSVPGNHAQGPA
jgi:hypothetical protein